MLHADRLLQFIESETTEIGTYIVITSQEIFASPIAAWSESVNEHEVKYLVDYLCSRGWIAKHNTRHFKGEYFLTVE